MTKEELLALCDFNRVGWANWRGVDLRTFDLSPADLSPVDLSGANCADKLENQLECWGAPDLYDTVEEFLAHCQETFGEQPLLTESGGDYIDSRGVVVLMLVDAS
jgi:hypothetical protein